MQQSLSESWLDFVATKIGSGGIVNMLTRRPRMPVTQILALLSIIEGWADVKVFAAVARQLTREYML